MGHLRISEAQIDFTDRSRRRPFDTTVGPISLELKKFRTRRDNQSPYSFSGRTESGEKFAWSGNVLIEPIRSKGTFTFDDLQLPKYAPYYQDATGAEIRKGVLGLKATYDLEWGTERRVVKIVDGSASLRDLVVGRRDGGDPAIELPRFDVAGFHADVLTQELAITRMALEGGWIRVRRGPDGAIDLVSLLRRPPPDKAAAPGSPDAGSSAPAAPREARPPTFQLGELSVKEVRFEVEDAVPSPAVEAEVDVERLVLTGLSNDPAGTTTLDGVARVDGTGRVIARGTVRPLQSSGDVELLVENLDISPLTPYLAGLLDASLEEAVLGVKGRATFDAAKADPNLVLPGRLPAGRAAHDGRTARGGVPALEEPAPGGHRRGARQDGAAFDPAAGAAALRAVIREDGVRNLDVVARREPARSRPGQGEAGAEAAPPRATAAPGAFGRSRRSAGQSGPSRSRTDASALVDRSVEAGCHDRADRPDGRGSRPLLRAALQRPGAGRRQGRRRSDLDLGNPPASLPGGRHRPGHPVTGHRPHAARALRGEVRRLRAEQGKARPRPPLHGQGPGRWRPRTWPASTSSPWARSVPARTSHRSP